MGKALRAEHAIICFHSHFQQPANQVFQRQEKLYVPLLLSMQFCKQIKTFKKIQLEITEVFLFMLLEIGTTDAIRYRTKCGTSQLGFAQQQKEAGIAIGDLAILQELSPTQSLYPDTQTISLQQRVNTRSYSERAAVAYFISQQLRLPIFRQRKKSPQFLHQTHNL